jgi:thiamine-monophosphate kinase
MSVEDPLDEESIIKILWSGFGKPGGRSDPFDDDAAWVKNASGKKFLVGKADMFVASTDAPSQMTPAQMAKKSIVACVSDLAAKGVPPKYSLVSLGIPKKFASREFVSGLANGFAEVESKYNLQIIGGDTNATSDDTVIDCSIFGFADSIISRRGAKPGDLVGVSGKFGAQPAGLWILLGRAKSSDKDFEHKAVLSVLEPLARLPLGVKASKYLSSCIDSSDGLAISLYHLAESSDVDLELSQLPTEAGVETFAAENGLNPTELVLFGGEEYELVCTFPPRNQKVLSKLGIGTIGEVVGKSGNSPSVKLVRKPVARRGWLHFKS